MAPPVEPMDLAVVMKTVQRLAPADTVYTNGAGNYSGWLHRYVRYFGLQHHGRTQLAPTSGAMGYGVPAAVAAALLYPQRTVVNIAGDGDFLMTGQELATATGYGAGAGRQADQHRRRQRQLRHDPHAPGARVPGPRQRQRPVQPRLRRAGRGLWLAGARVDTTAEFEPAFAAALAGASGRRCSTSSWTPTSSPRAPRLTAIRQQARQRQG